MDLTRELRKERKILIRRHTLFDQNGRSTFTHSQMSNNTPRWSGLETPGMMEAKCSLLIQDDGGFDPRIKQLPKQRVLVYQDKGYNPDANSGSPNGDENFYVDFNGCTILQFEPSHGTQRTMPITLTVGGRCIFTPENYQDFNVMMRTKEQSLEMNISPNGNFDWPDVNSLLLCPLCGKHAVIPQDSDEYDNEYWLLFYPLLQITIMKGSQMTLGTRTICRLTCLECMEDLLEDMTLKVSPPSINGRKPKLSFTLPAKEVLTEAGSASFLENGPPRPETHPHENDILDAWTLYNLWEHSGAWEALQNDYRIVLSRSMHSDNGERNSRRQATSEPKPTKGTRCRNPSCRKIHGEKDPGTGEKTKLSVRSKQNHGEFYCSRSCKEATRESQKGDSLERQEEEIERQEKNKTTVRQTVSKRGRKKNGTDTDSRSVSQEEQIDRQEKNKTTVRYTESKSASKKNGTDTDRRSTPKSFKNNS